ncbi:MGMT family protein [Rhodanobacter aciditrophus]|uniref:MGMT family protein n=1 Tax=Rhodanobacter aciditrophus TaxID=1623218 RepID=A0ABW4B2W3_9GAMM
MPNQEMDSFKSKVIFILSHLPAGHVISYGELAKQAGRPNNARQVGKILKELPKDTKLPWYRVVNSKRYISFTEGTEAYRRQRSALEQEGWVISGQRLIIKEAP